MRNSDEPAPSSSVRLGAAADIREAMDRFRPGTVIAGKYRIDRLLGKGGMGMVVAATHLQLGERVALKFLLPRAAARRDFVTRFLREAQAAARIRSEHVARVHDVGTMEGGEPFMVMELLEGQDLNQRVRQGGPLPVAEAVEVLLQACEAIAEAHALGIIHRDLKPANLFLTRRPDGSPLVKVLDFGISKVEDPSDGEAGLTATQAMLGSPLYMSPEQIRSPRGVDARADVWSLGAILHVLLCGHPAFEAESPSATLAMIVTEDPTPLRSLRPDTPPPIEAIVLRCLEKDLAQRVQSADDLGRALLPFAPLRPRERAWELAEKAVDRTAAGASVSTRPPAVAAAPAAMGASRSGRSLLVASLIFGAALLVGGAVAAISVSRAAPVTASTTSAVLTVAAAPAPPPSAEPAPTAAPPPSATAIAAASASVSAAPSAAPPPLHGRLPTKGTSKVDPLGDRY